LPNPSAAIAMTSGADSADPAVSRFLDAVWMERGLSAEHPRRLRADLTALARCSPSSSVPIMRTSRADLQDFIAWRVRAGARPRSTARQAVQFPAFLPLLHARGRDQRGPTAQIAMPKIGRSLPARSPRRRSNRCCRRRW